MNLQAHFRSGLGGLFVHISGLDQLNVSFFGTVPSITFYYVTYDFMKSVMERISILPGDEGAKATSPDWRDWNSTVRG